MLKQGQPQRKYRTHQTLEQKRVNDEKRAANDEKRAATRARKELKIIVDDLDEGFRRAHIERKILELALLTPEVIRRVLNLELEVGYSAQSIRRILKANRKSAGPGPRAPHRIRATIVSLLTQDLKMKTIDIWKLTGEIGNKNTFYDLVADIRLSMQPSIRAMRHAK